MRAFSHEGTLVRIRDLQITDVPADVVPAKKRKVSE